MRPKTLPRKRGQSLKQYADTVVQDFRTRVGEKSKSVDGAWGEIFKALCDEGQHVRVVSPAAIVLYQRYFSMAVNFLKAYPDDDKQADLVKRVEEDLAHQHVWFSQMKDSKFYEEDEYHEGKIAHRRILHTLKSFA